MDATTSCIDEDQADHRAIAHTFRLEFTKQPYAGFYLFHLLFKEFADMREIVQKAFENATPFDYIVHVSMMTTEIPTGTNFCIPVFVKSRLI